MRIVQVILLVLIIIGVIMLFTQKFWVDPLVNFILQQSEWVVTQNGPLNTTFTIDGQNYTLADGRAEREVAPGSASKEVVTVFGQPVYGDLNGDKVNDAAMFLVQDSGGSGTFFYVVEAINYEGIFRGTNAMFLGDRIAPQNINIVNGTAVANFAERRADESMSTPPSVGKSIWIYYNTKTGQIAEL